MLWRAHQCPLASLVELCEGKMAPLELGAFVAHGHWLAPHGSAACEPQRPCVPEGWGAAGLSAPLFLSASVVCSFKAAKPRSKNKVSMIIGRGARRRAVCARAPVDSWPKHLGPHPQVTGREAVCMELRLPGGSAGAGLALLRA